MQLLTDEAAWMILPKLHRERKKKQHCNPDWLVSMGTKEQVNGRSK